MFTDLEKNIIIMALMYLKNDYTPEDLEEFGLVAVGGRHAGLRLEDKIQMLIEDFVGPTWDEAATLDAIKLQTTNHSRNKEN